MTSSFERIAEEILARAQRFDENESAYLQKNLDRDLRKQLSSSMDELDRMWRQGKPVQRRMQLVMQPLMWQAHTGIPSDRLRLGSATDPDAMLREGPNVEAFLDISAWAILGAMRMYGLLSSDQFFASLQLPLTALYVYLSSREFGSPSIFELRNNLAEKLALTDVDQIKPSDVRPPLPGFYIQMPPEALELKNQHTGWHKTSLIGIAESNFTEGPRAGRGLSCVFWCEPNAQSSAPTDDNAQTAFVSLPDGFNGTIEEFEASIFDDGRGPRAPFVKWQGKELSFVEGHALLRRFAINFCLYLSSPNPDIQPTNGRKPWQEVVEQAEQTRDEPRARRQVVIGKNFSVWDVGRSVKRLVRLTATDIMVRGHWRRQAHGVGRSLRRVIWIEPFVRRPTGDGVEGHEYAVKDGDIKRNPSDDYDDVTIEALEETCGPADR